ncbi:MAG: tetratricopeptide repeat protein [Cyclobacteriaceae bacterium]|nr:tetratricopeptide repeat protein [Cyclobacteriaceae bacterium]
MYHKTGIFSSILWFLIAVQTGAQAQSQAKIDSLKSELSRSGDVNRYYILWGLAYELFDVDNKEALKYSQEAHSLAKKDGNDSLVVVSGRLTGQLLRRVHKSEDAIELLQVIKPLAQKLKMDGELARILNTLALCHTFRAEYDKALEYNFESLVLREKEGDKEKIATALMNIGLVHYKMGTFDLALDYDLKAQESYRQAGTAVNIGLLINIGLCYNELFAFQKAQEYFESALSSCGTDCDNEVAMQAEYGLGSSLFFRNQLKPSEEHFEASYKIAIRIGDTRFRMENLLRLSKIALILKDYEKAKKYLEIASTIREMTDYREILKSFYRLEAEYFTALDDYKQASYYLKRVNELTDSIFNERVISNLSRVQAQYAQRENLAIIAEKNSILALNEQVITQQRSMNVLLGIVVSLITALVIVVYLNYRKIRAVNAELASAKQIIEDHNKFLDHLVEEKTKELVDTNEQLVKVNDELDNFIYKTSHDIRGPLASLKGMVNLAIMDVKDDKALGYLSKLDLTAEKLNMILTRLLIVNRINHAELKPEPIHFEPIIQEILTLEVKKGIPAKIKIDYEVAPDTQLISDRDMVRLILENLIDNAVKYYNDSERIQSFVRIQVGMEDGKATARVMDNGVGISRMNREKIFQMFVRASERSDTGGIGLYLAKLATEKLGGEINLISTDEKYTEFIVQFPDKLAKPNDKRHSENKPTVDLKAVSNAGAGTVA